MATYVDMYVCARTYTRTYIHTYIHTYIRTRDALYIMEIFGGSVVVRKPYCTQTLSLALEL